MATISANGQIFVLKKLQPLAFQYIFCRNFSTTENLSIKRKHISKWKNAFPSQVYVEADLPDRCFDKILGHENKSKLLRRRMFKALLDRLVTQDRVVVTVSKGKSLARLAELLIDTAKKGDEPGVYNLMQRKELIPHVFEELLPRYREQNGNYTKVYSIHSESLPFYHSGRLIDRHNGNSVVEFIGNSLPPLLPTREELERLTLEYMENKLEEKESRKGGTAL